jgi:hypothetical protein
VNSRPFDIAELSSFDLDPGVAFLGRISDLTSNVLAFTVTICPDEQSFAELGLLLDILGDINLILKRFSNDGSCPYRHR